MKLAPLTEMKGGQYWSLHIHSPNPLTDSLTTSFTLYFIEAFAQIGAGDSSSCWQVYENICPLLWYCSLRLPGTTLSPLLIDID